MLSDAHIHLDALSNESASELLGLGAGVLAVSCDPEGYERAWDLIADTSCEPVGMGFCKAGESRPERGAVSVALGLHPWRVPSDDAPSSQRELFEAELECFERQADEVRFIGEIGLDFWGDCSLTHDEQLVVFRRVCAALEDGEHVLSLHMRGADREALDCLEEHGTVPGNGHTLILHGFNGPSDQMMRALKMGCLFSLGERELKTKKGREYARQLPLERLLLETDMPRGQIIGMQARRKLGVEEWQLSLTRACELLTSIKGLEKKEVERLVNNTFSSLW